ncbi:MAG: cysteine desulfurase family protein [Elainellaceae cyanobacterium]
MQIYLDYSATTPPHPDAIALMHRVMTSQWGNPSSLHQWGVQAATCVEQARISVASLINAPIDTIVFTSGGTEADNFAILGTARRYPTPRHLIISSVEHSAIAEPARALEQQGWRVTRLPVSAQGRVAPEDLEAALRPDTVLVSVIYGQSEVGTLQPIHELGTVARRHGALFHTDAVQVAGRLPLDVQQLPVDMLSLSSHKLYGPQGAGALYIHPGVPLSPLLRGGGQERGLRSGTQATPAIAGFGAAAALASDGLTAESERLRRLRDRLLQQLQSEPRLRLTGDPVHRLPHHLSFYLSHGDGIQLSGKTIVRQMNLAGIGISAGSACHSGKLSPSPILKAMGYSDRAAKCGIRLSLGRHTTEADVDWVALTVRQVLDRCPAPALSPV